jgi:hypothetical protein
MTKLVECIRWREMEENRLARRDLNILAALLGRQAYGKEKGEKYE